MTRMIVALGLTLPLMGGCGLFGLDGCTDVVALNYEVGADNNDGSCEYSRVIFYKAQDGPSVTVSVDGAVIGTVTGFHASGPENCATPGNAHLQLRDGEPHEWLAERGTEFVTGSVVAQRNAPCIQVRTF